MESVTRPGLEEKNTDLREALFNEGPVGKIEEVQVSTERIVKLNGILYDLDPKNYRRSSLLLELPKNPSEFYHAVVRPWLNRSPVLARAEVRNSGTGLHAILWFDEPVAFETDEDRRHWIGVIKAVQAALPIDPDQPHITAVTRPLGSVNSKSGAKVSSLFTGERVPQGEVLALFHEMQEAPFATVMNILVGSKELQPCPLCDKPARKLTGLNYLGRCYGSCGDVKLGQLYDLVFAPRDHEGREEASANARTI